MLNGAQKRKLKSLSQRLDASVKLGKAGITESFLAGLSTELDRHELVKVKFDDFKDQRKTLAPQIAERSSSELVWVIGHVAVLYRQHSDPAKQKIKL